MEKSTQTTTSYYKILSDITKGHLRPGEKLKITALAKKYQTGASPIREALSRLVDSQLVTTEDNRGFWVTPLTEADVRDIHETFAEIEILALKKAIERGNDSWEANIHAALYQLGKKELAKEGATFEQWAPYNKAFHEALIAGCNSPHLLKIRQELYFLFERYIQISFSVQKEALDYNHEEHKALADATISRNHTLACRLLWHHIYDALDDIIIALRKTKALT